MAALGVARYTSNSKSIGLGRAPKDVAARSHHVKKDGATVGFQNPYPSSSHVSFPFFARHILWQRMTGNLKQPDTSPPTINVIKPEFLPTRTKSNKLRATWLGHACYYVEFPSGLRVIFDPVFEDRCSPFTLLGPKRYTERPCDIADIPFLDAVVISHSHYDHLSHTSVLEIQKHNPNAYFFVGLGLGSWFEEAGLKNVTELDWWEDAELSLTLGERNPQGDDACIDPEIISATFSCLPCQHASARTPFDRDTTLWCSWAVQTGGRSIWFGGDTGYPAIPREDIDMDGPEFAELPICPQFKQIGEHRGPFDLGLIPIGAYYPRVAFSGIHANPYDSVDIFQDTKCERAMGIHWGTWALTFEEVLEPPKLLQDAMKRKGLPATGVFDVCNIGESRDF
ncbi:Metallo-beta-lactamase [Fusarium oxysporum f. sp. vasinfectum]|nr:Metallo-beta-lactamase [Fusarium oxysporum f. sp. vasinfectum]KAK2923209.1 Metallo-beta-lactamase [Fusarium oxysporum f. sp. vasinfectum]